MPVYQCAICIENSFEVKQEIIDKILAENGKDTKLQFACNRCKKRIRRKRRNENKK